MKSGSLRIISNANVVTRPNPEVVGSNRDEVADSSVHLLRSASKGPESRHVLHHSFADIDNNDGLAVVPYGNGFVNGIIQAFQQDLHLVLRPDDIWLAITVQLSFYINGHAEEMRKFFVEHDDKKELVVDLTPQTMENLDIAYAAKLFAGLIQENVRVPDLKSWILPDFSTTTDNDISVAAMVMMATTKAYFEYIMLCGCGFPSVTLLGERDDWVKLSERLPRLATFGDEPAEWSKLLVKVVEKMIETFDHPDDEATKEFWMKAVHRTGAEASGRGLDTLSGWITAFCFWNEEGRMINQYSDEYIKLSSFDGEGDEDRKRLVIDDVIFPIIRAKSVPQSVVQVPVKVLDASTMLEYETTIIAGSVGMTATTSGSEVAPDTFQPRSGWWMLLDEVKQLGAEKLEKYVEILQERLNLS
ncbi:uncharacterized protein TRIVIDRAFT_159064 [Trichoderma virens Gv29-8]|uniref:Uncharacterized protein n=1 Tax=Hypocrea virens (strain Gv29-8 / FGSC 10586) TaxID=413071 RepID=G9N3V5_HYPVG|nr:uncharacterized protein TRIVIDRAFT_159064 [Trichoderma virens Gv29-8]EHK18284.1 hypothetical protein TRIVIDRAFT_159064 [Trichoderma virens Gv29-8]UKZ52498.1 hypothetical protein TrVGV298_006275 [Trichoderma virens]